VPASASLNCRAWDQPSQAAQASANCVEASAWYYYDFYTGNTTASQQASSAYYQQAGSDRKYGWIARPCTNTRQWVASSEAGSRLLGL
jgi:hypothetical protein